MEIPQSLFMIFLVICSSAFFVGYSQVTVSVGDTLACVQDLVPCMAYLSGTPPPPTECCVPLKKIAGDTKCLCTVFNNQAMLKNLNATLEDAVHLIKNCGANVDISPCSKGGAAASPSMPTAPSTHGTETKKNAAAALSQAGMWAAILSFIALIF